MDTPVRASHKDGSHILDRHDLANALVRQDENNLRLIRRLPSRFRSRGANEASPFAELCIYGRDLPCPSSNFYM